MCPPAKSKVWDSFVDFSYGYSYSDGEVDDPQEFPSDDEVRSEPAQDSCGSTLLEPWAQQR